MGHANQEIFVGRTTQLLYFSQDSESVNRALDDLGPCEIH